MDADGIGPWVEKETGARVARVERIALGFSRGTFLVACEDGREFVARLDVPDGPLSGTPLSLTRECEVHEALRDAPLPRAALVAAAPDGSALLFEKAPGTHDLAALSRPDRETVLDDYLDRIADLHLLPLAGLPLRHDADPFDAELGRWEAALTMRARRSWPLLRLAFAALRRHAPRPAADELVLCHGDVGPRNFLHDGRRVTALLDWEFWHVGEPEDDLAWWIWRAHERTSDCGDLGAQLARWTARTGRPLDGPRIDYYQVLVKLRSVVVAVVALDNGARGVDHSVLLPIVWTLSYQIARDLLHLDGEGLDLGWDAADEPSAALGDEARHFLGRDVTEVLVPGAGSSEARRQAAAVAVYAEHLAAVARLGPSVVRADAADMRRYAGVADPAELDALVASGERSRALTAMFGRQAHRRMHLWPTALARVPTAGIRVADLTPAAPQ
jgi:aminoglycoside phosphotransferase (APT) family kinase protein